MDGKRAAQKMSLLGYPLRSVPSWWILRRPWCWILTAWYTIKLTSWPFGPWCSGHLFEDNYDDKMVTLSHCGVCGLFTFGWQHYEPGTPEAMTRLEAWKEGKR